MHSFIHSGMRRLFGCRSTGRRSSRTWAPWSRSISSCSTSPQVRHSLTLYYGTVHCRPKLGLRRGSTVTSRHVLQVHRCGTPLHFITVRYTVELSWGSGEVVLWHPALRTRIRIRRIHIFLGFPDPHQNFMGDTGDIYSNSCKGKVQCSGSGSCSSVTFKKPKKVFSKLFAYDLP